MTDPDAAHVLALYFGAGEVGHRAPYVRFTRSVAAAATRVEVSGPDTVSARCEPSARRTVHRLMPLGWKGADDVDANLYREVADADLDVVVRQAIGALRDDFGLPHPSLLTYEAKGPSAVAAERLDLTLTSEVSRERTIKPVARQAVVAVRDRDHLRHLISEAIRENNGARLRSMPAATSS